MIRYALAGLGFGAVLVAGLLALRRLASDPELPELPDVQANADGFAPIDIPESIDAMVTRAKRWLWPSGAEPYRATINQAAQANGIPADLLARVLHQESRFRPDIIDGRVRSPVGAAGIAQFMPATAAEFGIDPLNPAQAIPAAARYLRRLYNRFGDWPRALAAYNWGQGNVARRGLDKAPAETRTYVAQVLGDVQL